MMYERALGLSPNDSRILTNLAAVHSGSPETSVEYATRALAIDPNNLHAIVNLAQYYEVRCILL